jgi:Uma2 family endonuclease
METMIRPPKTLLEVYKSLPEGTNAQLIENNLIMSPAPKDIHQKVLDKIYRRLGNFIEEKELGETRTAPYDVYLDEFNVYQPDIIFIASENISKINEDGLQGAPDMVIEILSSRTAKEDKGRKKNAYERCGVKEYWIVDPVTRKTMGFSLVNEAFISLASETGIIRSVLLNTEIIF